LPPDPGPFLLLFDTLICYQPADTAAPQRHALCPAPFCVSRNPAPLGEDDEKRFQRLLADLQNHGREYYQGAIFSRSTRADLAADEKSVRALITQIAAGGNSQPGDDSEELWKARLFLALAEFRFIQEWELNRQLQEVEKRKKELFTDLGTEDVGPAPATAPPTPPAGADASAPAHLRAWSILHQAERQDAPLLATASPVSAGLLLEEYRRNATVQPELLATLALPETVSMEELDDRRQQLAAGRALLDKGIDQLLAGDLPAARQLIRQGEQQWNDSGAETNDHLYLVFLAGTSSRSLLAGFCRRADAGGTGPGIVLAVKARDFTIDHLQV